MKINSIWSDVELPKYPTLTENKKVKYLIIGGGMTGINCLYHLRNEDVILVEQNNLASGVTKNTTGKLTYLQDSLYEKIINQTNEDYARQYLLSQLAAIRLAKKIIKDNNIECDLVKTKSFLFTTTEKDIQKIKQTKKFLEDNHIVVGENHMKEVSNLYSIDVSDTYIFHPLKYIAGLLKTIDSSKIFENTKITKIKKENDYYICYTKQGTIEASKVILATNYPYFIYPYFFPFKCYLEKSYCLAYPKKRNPISMISYDKPVLSMRTHQNYTILVGETHCNHENVDDNQHFQNLLKKIDDKPDYLWSNVDVMTNDYLPYIGYFKKNLLMATGFNTWGMTNAILSGKIIHDILLNKDNDYIKLFDPLRTKNFLRIFSDTLGTIKGYIEGLKYTNPKVIYTKKNGVDVIIYKDGKKEYIVKRKCPHAKCNLIFNEIEKTFDCPCHSSRFDLNGKCIKGPSKEDISINR